ncbi:MAG: hypothetical protein J3K34DRAFT_413741, partial [Monoraphidium minutum]
ACGAAAAAGAAAEGAAKPLRACKGCYSVAYCGTACQKRHWPEHRGACKQAAAAAAEAHGAAAAGEGA